MKDVMIVIGAGQISMAIARRTGSSKKIILGDKNMKNCEAIARIMRDAGFDVEPFEMDLSSRESIKAMIAKAQEFGEIKYLVNGAGVSPSQASIETILKVDLYGTAVLLEEVGKVIARGGAGVTISSQSSWRMPQLTPEQDRQLATTPTEELLGLEILKPENIKDTALGAAESVHAVLFKGLIQQTAGEVFDLGNKETASMLHKTASCSLATPL